MSEKVENVCKNVHFGPGAKIAIIPSVFNDSGTYFRVLAYFTKKASFPVEITKFSRKSLNLVKITKFS